MDRYPESWQTKQRKAADKLRASFREPERWERSPSVNASILAIAHRDRQEIIAELSRGPMSTQQLLTAMPRLSQQKMSMHLNYLYESEWVSQKRVPKSATKIWTLNAGIYCDVIDILTSMNAPAYDRIKARRKAKRDAV